MLGIFPEIGVPRESSLNDLLEVDHGGHRGKAVQAESGVTSKAHVGASREDGGNLWLAKATPRHWLEQGKKVAVSHAPTYFGEAGYTIVSDADNGKITATVDLPSRNPPTSVLLRLHHPKASPIKDVTGERKALEGLRWEQGSDFLGGFDRQSDRAGELLTN